MQIFKWLIKRENRTNMCRESWILIAVPKLRLWPFSRFAKIKLPIFFRRHDFFSKIPRKTREIQKYERFMTFLRRKGFNVIKLCIVRAILGSQALELCSPSLPRRSGEQISRALGPQYRPYNI